MTQWLKLASGAVFALLVAGALTLGARTAFAQPVSRDCPNDGWVWLGSCVTQGECQGKCEIVHGPDVVGQCVGGCCRCLF